MNEITNSFWPLLASIVTLVGSFFLLAGGLGVLRMPDLYNRIQAGTKATTLGTILSLLGMGICYPGWLSKIFVLILFILVTNPVSSHVLARASHFIKIPKSPKTQYDALENEEKRRGEL